MRRIRAGVELDLAPGALAAEMHDRFAVPDPERHRDLVIRVSSYSACFTDLGRALQDEIIARTEFGAH